MEYEHPDEDEIEAFVLRFSRKIAEQLHAEATEELNAKGLLESTDNLIDYFYDGVMSALYDVRDASFEEREGMTLVQAHKANIALFAKLSPGKGGL